MFLVLGHRSSQLQSTRSSRTSSPSIIRHRSNNYRKNQSNVNIESNPIKTEQVKYTFVC
jgi:hypothetical protein